MGICKAVFPCQTGLPVGSPVALIQIQPAVYVHTVSRDIIGKF